MSYTIFDVMLAIQRRVGDGVSGLTNAAGAVTYAVDTTRIEPDDFWNGGTLFLLGADAGGGSKLDRAFKVTDWILSSGRITFATLSWAPTSLTQYELYSSRFTKDAMLQAINAALDTIEIRDWDATTAVTGAFRYSLPSGVSQVRKVEIGNTTDGWEEHRHWHVEDGDSYIFFDKDEPTDTADYIKLTYATRFSQVGGSTEASPLYQDWTIDEVDFSRLVMAAIVNLLRNRLLQVGTDEPNVAILLKSYEMELARSMTASESRVKHAQRFAKW